MSDFIRNQKEVYKNLKPCFCPVLGEIVYFTAHGINHLMYKRKRLRSVNERYYRLSLIKYIVPTIKYSKNIGFRESGGVLRCNLSYRIDSNIIKVILEKRHANGKYTFLSIMRKRLK